MHQPHTSQCTFACKQPPSAKKIALRARPHEHSTSFGVAWVVGSGTKSQESTCFAGVWYGGNTTWVHARAVLLQWPAWLSGCGGASNVVNTATAGPCGVAARGARAADAMAPHERMPPLGMLVTIATEHGATTITFGWWRTAGIHHNADTHTHTHRRAYRAHNGPPTATQPPMATNMTWYVTVNPVTSFGGAVTPRA